jgi:hypothetical protein
MRLIVALVMFFRLRSLDRRTQTRAAEAHKTLQSRESPELTLQVFQSDMIDLAGKAPQLILSSSRPVL